MDSSMRWNCFIFSMFSKSLRRRVLAATSPGARPSQRSPGEKKHPESEEESGASRGAQATLHIPTGKPQSKSRGENTQFLPGHQHFTSKDPGVSAWGFRLSPHPRRPGSFGKGQRCPLGPHVLAAPTAPSVQLCRDSPHHDPSLGRGDVGSVGQSPLPDPKETGEM